MKPIDHLYDLIKQSNFITIGYNHREERLKDELIYRLPTFKLKYIDTSFTFENVKDVIKQKKRENRLDYLVNNTEEFIDISKFDYLVVDLEDIPSDKDDNQDLFKRSLLIRDLLVSMRSGAIENDYKVIFTTPTYRLMDDNLNIKLKGGDHSMYIADLVFILEEGFAKITKNRFSISDEIICLDEL